MKCEVGQEVTLEYKEDEKANPVLSFEMKADTAKAEKTTEKTEE